MNISDAAELTGLSAHTIRYYEKTGLLPKIRRSEAGIRTFSASDIRFMTFISSLRKTGMSLADITGFTADGCILERIEKGDIPVSTVSNRITILNNHRNQLLKQRADIDQLIGSVDRELGVYQAYLGGRTDQTGSDRK